MDANTLKTILVCSDPSGITREEKRITFSYDAMVKAATLLGVEIASKRETFRMLREMGFTDVKVDSEIRIGAPLKLFIAILVPVVQDVLAKYKEA